MRLKFNKNLFKICTVTLICLNLFATAQIAKIPFEFDEGHIYIKVQANQSDTLRYVFDTGCTGATIDSTTAERIGIPKENRQNVSVDGSGGPQDYTMAVGQSLCIANLEIKDINLVLVNFASLSAATGIRLNGIVGYEVMDHYLTQIDFDNNKLLFYTNISDVDTTDYEVIPFEFNKGVLIPRFPISIQLASGEKFTGRVMFDSGMENTLLLSAGFNKFNKISEKLTDKLNGVSRGMNTTNTEEKSMIKSMSFNGFSFGQMPISLTVNDQAEPNNTYLGILGLDIIKRFNVIMDYANKKIYLKPNKYYTETFTTL